MRVLKTILATAITWVAISGLVYAILWRFETALLIMAGIGTGIVIIAPIYHWWDKFE